MSKICDKFILLPEECKKLNSHQWIIRDGKYICEFCGIECAELEGKDAYERNILKSVKGL